MTGRPVGNSADGRFGRLKVGLCIMWLAFAVTVSVLSLPLWGSDPHRPSYLRVSLSFSPFPSRNRPSLVNWGVVVMWKVTLSPSVFPPRFNQSSCKDAIFFVSSLNHLWDLISRHATFIIRSAGFLLTLSTLRMVIFDLLQNQTGQVTERPPPIYVFSVFLQNGFSEQNKTVEL